MYGHTRSRLAVPGPSQPHHRTPFMPGEKKILGPPLRKRRCDRRRPPGAHISELDLQKP